MNELDFMSFHHDLKVNTRGTVSLLLPLKTMPHCYLTLS